MTPKLLLVLALVLSPFVAVPARATECTHDTAVSALGVLQSVVDNGDHFGFPTLPTDTADLGANAGVPFIETLSADSLTLMEKSVLAAHHQADAVRFALAGRCGDPLTAAETNKGRDMINHFDPWITAWEAALPAERARRATDKSEAALICDTAANLADAQARLAREKANPSGVVDLVALHTDGQMVQALTSILAARKNLFLRDRKKPFAQVMCAPGK